MEILIAVITRTSRKSGEVRDRGTMRLLWLTIFLAMTLAGFARYMLPSTFSALAIQAAIPLIVVGLAVRLYSVFSLGRAFSANVAIREDQTLNQSGIYGLIRHPSYLGMVLIFLAVGLNSGNVIGLLFAAVPSTVALLYRIRVEEAALVSAFGSTYETYMTRTKRLVPWVY